jgi:hypothetical protein
MHPAHLILGVQLIFPGATPSCNIYLFSLSLRQWWGGDDEPLNDTIPAIDVESSRVQTLGWVFRQSALKRCSQAGQAHSQPFSMAGIPSGGLLLILTLCPNYYLPIDISYQQLPELNYAKSYILSAWTMHRKHSLCIVVWRYRICRNVFNEPLTTDMLHNPISIVVCVYYLATAVSMAQQFLHGQISTICIQKIGYKMLAITSTYMNFMFIILRLQRIVNNWQPCWNIFNLLKTCFWWFV